MFKLLEKTRWDDIKEDEVYALMNDGDIDIEARVINGRSIILSSDSWYNNGIETSHPLYNQEIYKLPVSVQNLYITK